MYHHLFIFKPSLWLGEGKIRLNMVQEELNFFTRWKTQQSDATGLIESIQEIQVKGLSDIMINQFSFFAITPTQFSLELENHALGKIQGGGILNEKVIAWEFRVPDIGFEGLELYEKEGEHAYLMRAEYTTSDQFRTSIEGRIWLPDGLEEQT